MFGKVLHTLLLLAPLPVLAQPAAPTGSGTPPRLIIAISVDQFSADLFSEYRPYYTGGLKRLSGGAVFPRGYQSHAATETCPGHSTILTGSRPSRTGIIANSWIDQKAGRADKTIYCAEDESQAGSSSSNYVASPIHLRVPTLGERMKAANPATRNIAIAGKDRAAIMMGGAKADQIWWLSSKGYVSYPGIATPPLVARVNEIFQQRLAEPNAGFELPAQCAAKDFPVRVAPDRTVGTGRFERPAGRYDAFRASPEQDAMTLAFAAATIETMGLGKQPQTDIISIGLSATDVIGHAYGTEGTESCIQVDRLDRELGAFFDRLDQQGLDYVVVLTADHGGHDLPERHQQNAMPMEQRVDPALLPGALAKAVAARTGTEAKGLILGDGPSGDLYFNLGLTPAQRAKVEAATLALLRAHPQVEAVFTKAQLAATPSPSGPPESWSLIQEARASFNTERSGDLLLLLKPRITPITDPSHGSVATHGSPWDTDRRVPMLFWRKGMRSFEQPLGVETVDIMPTLAALIGLPIPRSEIDGRCLDLIAGPEDSCAGR
ncbi:alkaline phosphatase family protein [Sphingomonadales bacterium 56]|uniref:alkaline phosphatase family protein n=1 Tax=unclassified Sphingobium TaxID=2611147 RepID=UPI00191A916F|nr:MULTISPECIES: alkaline phosphatase family protein [unclassified Sphingobium]MBY2927245.1 alkaline phosphatase family protein [Sphingomonadales bacterium 56]MBY2957313.1 alkaline phosphatase family protein [Sphingomonadales bacterium 58]CAD7334805.1 Alkaline phosphatase PhoK [Sphingobium sp. S8]CAD7334824.1 Alkaline phosphatase PhoK [Sphingobium sp. S6]